MNWTPEQRLRLAVVSVPPWWMRLTPTQKGLSVSRPEARQALAKYLRNLRL